LGAWHVRDESYAKALAELVNYQHQSPFAAHWGGGTTSSSDGQRYPVGGRGPIAASTTADGGPPSGPALLSRFGAGGLSAARFVDG
jgi:hypothetical protein